MNAFLVETMTMAPNSCMMCGKGNVPDRETGEVGPYANLGIDYNWGDSGYLCGDCVGQLAMLFNWISPDREKQLARKISRLEQKIHDLESEIDMRRRRERTELKRARVAVGPPEEESVTTDPSLLLGKR